MRAVIIGAGIVGAACAYELQREGFQVTVCDPGVIGGGATAAGMGHLAVMDDSPAQFALTSYSQALWRELAEELPPTAEILPCGSLWIAADAEEMAEVHRKFAYYSERGIPVEVLDSQQLAEAEPHLRPGMAGGLLMSADGVCYPPCAAEWLLRSVSVIRARVVRLAEGEVTLDRGSRLEADVIIVANGTAAVDLFPDLPLAQRKGHLLITDRYPGWLRHQLIELGYLKSAHSTTADSVAFNAQPRATGQILIGSSRQFGAVNGEIDPPMLARMLQRAFEYMPGLAQLASIRTWTGFRAATPDKLPVIGHAPGYSTVYLATGHEGLGISTSLATAKLLADQLMNRESRIPREPYLPGRSYSHD